MKRVKPYHPPQSPPNYLYVVDDGASCVVELPLELRMKPNPPKWKIILTAFVWTFVGICSGYVAIHNG